MSHSPHNQGPHPQGPHTQGPQKQGPQDSARGRPGRQRHPARTIAAASLSALLAATILATGSPMTVGNFPASPAAAQEIRTDMETIRYGRALAERNCAECHETSLDGDSPNPLAPPFWTMFTRRPAETIAQMLINKSGPAHSGMPRFEVTESQAIHLASWIAWVQPVAHGRRLVEENCGACHAVGLNDESSHPDAPAFRELSREYPIDALEEAFAGTIETGHPDMPIFKVNDLQLQDMLAYIGQLQEDFMEGGTEPAD